MRAGFRARFWNRFLIVFLSVCLVSGVDGGKSTANALSVTRIPVCVVKTTGQMIGRTSGACQRSMRQDVWVSTNSSSVVCVQKSTKLLVMSLTKKCFGKNVPISQFTKTGDVNVCRQDSTKVLTATVKAACPKGQTLLKLSKTKVLSVVSRMTVCLVKTSGQMFGRTSGACLKSMRQDVWVSTNSSSVVCVRKKTKEMAMPKTRQCVKGFELASKYLQGTDLKICRQNVTKLLTIKAKKGQCATGQTLLTMTTQLANPIVPTTTAPNVGGLATGSSTTTISTISPNTTTVPTNTTSSTTSTTTTVPTTTTTTSSTSSTSSTTSTTTTVPTVPLPLATSLTATSATIVSGDSTTITPVFSRGTATVNHSVGTVTSGVGFVVSPTVATTYTLTVTNSDGASATTTVTIAVNSLSITTQPESLTINSGLLGRFSVVASGTGVLSYQWSNSVGIIDALNARSDLFQTGAGETYSVTVTSTLNGTTVSKTSNSAELSVNAVTITTQPQTVTIAEGGEGICTVRATGTGVLSYQWYIDDVLVVGGTSRDLPVTTESNCKAVVTSTLAGLTVDAYSTSANVWVNSAVITSQPTDSVFTAGSFIPISVGLQSAAIGQTFAYQWFRGGVAISSANSATYNASIAGSYYVEITATMNATVSTKNSATVIVSSVAAPLITSVVTGSSRIVSGSSTTITAVFSGGSAIMTPGNTVLSSGVAVTVSPTVSTTYSVTVLNAAGTSATATSSIIVENGIVSVLSSQLSQYHAPGSSMIRLGDGRVLILGGTSKVAELFDPTTNAFSNTGSMIVQRSAPAVVLLANGKVLVMGGYSNQVNYPAIQSAELFDPATGIFTSTGNMTEARSGPIAVVLANGKVLVAGGIRNSSYLQSADLYDPIAGSFASTGLMNVPRADATATLLTDGNVLVAGGQNFGGGSYARLSSASIYNTASGSWTSTSNSMNTARSEAKAVILSDGRVLIVGGMRTNTVALASTEIFDMATMSFVSSTPTMDSSRWTSGVVALSDGTVLVIGGSNNGGTTYDSLLLFDPTNNSFTHLAAVLTSTRYNVLATLLSDGRVLITDAWNKSAFLYTP